MWSMSKAYKVLPSMAKGVSFEVPPEGQKPSNYITLSQMKCGEAILFPTDYEVRHLAPSKYPFVLDYYGERELMVEEESKIIEVGSDDGVIPMMMTIIMLKITRVKVYMPCPGMFLLEML